MIAVQGLRPGEAYTVWFIDFDQPRACSAAPCAIADVLGNNPLGVLAGETGEAAFSGRCADLRFLPGAGIHLPIFAHGPVNAEDDRPLARQLLTPQLPVLGAPGLGASADGNIGHPVAVAVFTIPEPRH